MIKLLGVVYLLIPTLIILAIYSEGGLFGVGLFLFYVVCTKCILSMPKYGIRMLKYGSKT